MVFVSEVTKLPVTLRLWYSVGSWLVRKNSFPEPIDAQKKGLGPEESGFDLIVCMCLIPITVLIHALSNAGLSLDFPQRS